MILSLIVVAAFSISGSLYSMEKENDEKLDIKLSKFEDSRIVTISETVHKVTWVYSLFVNPNTKKIDYGCSGSYSIGGTLIQVMCDSFQKQVLEGYKKALLDAYKNRYSDN